MGRAEKLRQKILDLVSVYHREAFCQGDFIPGETPVPIAGRVFDAEDLRYLVDASGLLADHGSLCI